MGHIHTEAYISNEKWKDEAKSGLYCPPDVVDYYKRGTYKIDNHANCRHCPARFWIDMALHWCVIKDEPVDYLYPPTCTEWEWDKFISEHV